MDSATAQRADRRAPANISSNSANTGRHNLTVEFTADHGTVIFPKDARGADHPGDAMVTFDAGADALRGPDRRQLDRSSSKA